MATVHYPTTSRQTHTHPAAARPDARPAQPIPDDTADDMPAWLVWLSAAVSVPLLLFVMHGMAMLALDQWAPLP